MKRAVVEVTRNFERNLDDIERFLAEGERGARFDALLDLLFDTVIPNLERFPDLGADFLARRPRSTQGVARVERLRGRIGEGASMREHIIGDYLFLYAVRGRRLWLLSLRHHRQLAYDLRATWAR